jgi:hypothetical protein
MISEYEAVQRLLDYARDLGILAHHCNDSRYCQGNGMPDVIAAGPRGVAFIEIKTDSFSRVRPEQTSWHHMLRASGQQAWILTIAELPAAFDILESIAQ